MEKMSDPQAERKLAVDLFNSVWAYLEKKKRSRAEDDAMLHAAHASRHHWGQVGEPLNFARGEWQISRVYVALKRPEPALHHAARCLAICRAHKIGDFDLAYAYEALARASVLARKKADAARWRKLAERAASGIAKAEDRAYFEKDLATLG